MSTVTIQLHRDTAANWTSVNRVLSQGEPGFETDTGKLKIGDGSTAWTSLAYVAIPNPPDGVWDKTINLALLATDPVLATPGTWALGATSSSFTGGILENTTKAQNDEFGFDVNLDAGTWDVSLVYVTLSTGGIVTTAIDASSLGTIDTYSGSTTYNVTHTFTSVSIAANGKHRVTFTIGSKNASSTAYELIGQAIRFRRTA